MSALEILKQPFDLLLALQQSETFIHRITAAGERVGSEVGGVLSLDLRLIPLERRCSTIEGDGRLDRLGCLPERARATTLCDEEFAAAAGFAELGLQLGEGGTEKVGLPCWSSSC
jgi:hypothetical protein